MTNQIPTAVRSSRRSKSLNPQHQTLNSSKAHQWFIFQESAIAAMVRKKQPINPHRMARPHRGPPEAKPKSPGSGRPGGPPHQEVRQAWERSTSGTSARTQGACSDKETGQRRTRIPSAQKALNSLVSRMEQAARRAWPIAAGFLSASILPGKKAPLPLSQLVSEPQRGSVGVRT